MPEFEKDYFEAVYGKDYEKRNPLRKLRYYLKEIYDVKPSGSIFDIGCAYGLFLSLAKQYYDVSGCDISAHAVAEARRRFPDIEVFQTSIETLRLNKTFDIITCFDVLEHVKDIDGAFEKVEGFLRKNGVIVLTVPVYDTIVGRLVSIIDKDETHIWKKGRDFWKEKLMTHGFRLLKDIGLWRYYLMGHYIFFGGKIWRNFSPAIFIIGQRDDIHSSSRI